MKSSMNFTAVYLNLFSFFFLRNKKNKKYVLNTFSNAKKKKNQTGYNKSEPNIGGDEAQFRESLPILGHLF